MNQRGLLLHVHTEGGHGADRLRLVLRLTLAGVRGRVSTRLGQARETRPVFTCGGRGGGEDTRTGSEVRGLDEGADVSVWPAVVLTLDLYDSLQRGPRLWARLLLRPLEAGVALQGNTRVVNGAGRHETPNQDPSATGGFALLISLRHAGQKKIACTLWDFTSKFNVDELDLGTLLRMRSTDCRYWRVTCLLCARFE